MPARYALKIRTKYTAAVTSDEKYVAQYTVKTNNLLCEVDYFVVCVHAGRMGACFNAQVCVKAVGLAADGGAHLVDDPAGVTGQCAHIGFTAQGVVQVQQHRNVLQLVVHCHRA